MFLKVAHQIAKQPWIYDRIQRAAGVNKVYARLASHFSGASSRELILDIGGGTGSLKTHCRQIGRYVCLDIEWEKLRGFRAKFSDGAAVLADACQMPIADGSVDTAVCMFVAHHLSDDNLPGMLSEIDRVLRRDGRLIFLDPVLDDKRLAGRVLWRLDRGSFPRTPAVLKRALQDRFTPVFWNEFAVWHRYALGVLQKAKSPSAAAPHIQYG